MNPFLANPFLNILEPSLLLIIDVQDRQDCQNMVPPLLYLQ